MRSTGIGWSLGIGRLGAIIGPMMGGVLLTLNMPLQFNFLAFAIPRIIAAITIWFVREKQTPSHKGVIQKEQILQEIDAWVTTD